MGNNIDYAKVLKAKKTDWDRISRYISADTSMVNQEYINSFLKDADSYFKTAESDYGNVSWGNATNSYNTKNQAWTDLTSRADAVGAYLFNNRNSISQDVYDNYQKYLDSFYEGGQGVVNSFKSSADYYNQWATQEEYDTWYKDYQEKQKMAYSAEGKLGWQKYQTDLATPKDTTPDWADAVLKSQATYSDNPLVSMYLNQVYEYQRDDSYRRPNDNWNNEEKNIFGYYYNIDPEQAYQYAIDLNNEKNRRREQESLAKIASSATESFGSGLGHSLVSLFAASTGIGDAMNYFAMYQAGRPITEDGIVTPFEYSQAVQSGISTELNDMGGTVNVGGIDIGLGNAYGLGMSVAQSMISRHLLGGVGTLLNYFGQGAAQGIKEAKQRGASDDQAILYGASLGAFEGLAEKLQFDRLMSKTLSSATLKTTLKNLLAQSGSEALEEGTTAIFNNIADNFIMQDKSAYHERVEELVASGMGREEASKKAWNEIGVEILYDSVAGALSGAISGSVETNIKNYNVNQAFKDTYLNNDPEALKTLLTSIALENPDADISGLMSKYEQGKKISANELRRFVYNNEKNLWDKDYSKMVDATETRLNELGEMSNVRALAESIVKGQFGNFNDAILNAEQSMLNSGDAKVLQYAMADYKGDNSNLSSKEKKAIKESVFGKSAQAELAHDKNSQEEYNNWAENAGTARINKGASGVAKTRATLNALNNNTKAPTASQNAFNYRSGVVANNLTKEGAQQKYSSEKADLEAIATNRGYKGTTHEAFVKNYNGENIEEYQLGFDEAYKMGRNNIPKDELKNAEFRSYINESAQLMAYNSGKIDAKYEAIKTKVITTRGGAKVTIPYSTQALTESRKTTIEIMKAMAEMTKVNMSVMESKLDHGLYDPKTNTISIDINLDGKDYMVFTLAHELTHHIKRVLPEQFNDFAEMLFEEIGKKMSINDRIKIWEQNNKKYYPKLTPTELNDLAYEEVVCEMCESFLTDETVARRLSEKVQKENKTLWEKIKDFFTDLINRLKEVYKGLDPQSENGRLVREMTNDLTKVKEAWAELIIESGKVEQTVEDGGEKSSKKDFVDYDKPITLSDIEILRSIGKKSINKFTADEIKKAQKWAYKFYQELGTKSPFFRTWFGEWRAHDQSKKNIVSVPTINISEASLAKGDYTIRDTGWNVYAGKTLNDDTRHHSGGDRINVKSLNAIESILDNAILFDTVVSEPDTNKKSGNTAFLHKLYTPIQYDGKSYIAKTTVEEFYNETINNVSRRAYNLKAIKIELAGGQLGNNSSSSRPDTSSINSISDLYEFVKTFDKEFTPAPEVDKVLLNEDGTPKVFYHGTGARFTEFDPNEIAFNEGTYFFAENREDAAAYGKNIYEVYLTGRKLADYDNQPSEFYKLRDKRKQVEWLKEKGYDGWYADMDSGGWGELSVFSPEQIKSAIDNIGTFSKYDKDIRHSRKDEEYLSAVNRGDMETAQRMVDEAAKEAGYTEEVFHGMGDRYNIYKSGNGQYGSGVYFTYDKSIGQEYGTVVDHLYVKVGKIANYDDAYETLGKRNDQTLDEFAQVLGFPSFDEMIEDWDNDPTDVASNSRLVELLKNRGFEGFVDEGNAGFVLWDFDGIEYRIKLADPVTYDDEGNVIPLSQRFNAENKDIRYSRKGVNKDGIEVYETSEETMKLTWKEREAKYLDLMKNEYRGRTAKFVRNGHTFYAQFDPKGIRKVIKGDSRSKGNSLKALIKAGADGDIFELVERSNYSHSSKNRKNHTPADYFDYFVKTVQIDGKVFDLIADVEKMYGGDGGYVYTLALTENTTIKASPAHEPPDKVSVKGARNASDNSISQKSQVVNTNLEKSENYQEEFVHSRKIPDPLSSRELLSKALTKVAKGEEKTLLEQYKSNLRMIKGEYDNLLKLRKEIDAIKYKKSITYKGENLSVKEFEQIAYTKANEMGVDAENVKFKALKDTGKYIATVNGIKILEADKAFRSKEEIELLNTLEHNYQATLTRISKYDASLLRIEAMQPIKDLLKRETAKARKEAEQRGKEALKEYKAQAIEEQKAITQRYQEARKKNVEGRKTTEMRNKLLNTVHTLDQLLVNPTKKKHIPIGLQKPVAEALNILNMDTVGAEERLAKITAELKVTDDPYEMEILLERYNRIKAQGDKIKDKIDSLKAAYAEILNSDDNIIRNSYDEVIANTIEQVSSKVGDTAVRDMYCEQLEMLYKMYRMILKTIRDANKAFKAAKDTDISTLGQNVMGEVKKYERLNKKTIGLVERGKNLDWNNLKPTYAFERIGSQTLIDLYNNVRKGEDVWAQDVSEAKAYWLAQRAKYNYDSWDMNKTYSFKSKLGKDFDLTLGQIMSLYAYSRRGEQAVNHLIIGGFVYDKTTTREEKTKKGIKYTVTLNDSTPYSLNEEILAKIIGTLNNTQKSFVESMQEYLSTVMGEKGNEVSLEMYEIKLFGEKNYFPLKSSRVFLERLEEQANGTVKIKNKGFAKETTPRANNPIVLSSFMDVWLGHCDEMSLYHAFTLPLEDFYRVYNYQERAEEDKDREGVVMNLENAYGYSVTSYIDQLLTDINGGTRADPRASLGTQLTAKFKKAATFASLSVVAQQPSSIVRAMVYVDPKYFIDKPSRSNHKKNWEEVKKYAPVAIIKEMGYFDIGVGRATKDWMMEDYGWKEKAEEYLSKAPALADEVTWCWLWRAIKREAHATHPDLKINSEEFLKVCGDRFTEVITKTQVYDSVFSRSANMRSKDGWMKMATSFMAESTTIANMFEDAVLKAKRGNKKHLGKTGASIIASALVNSICVSFVYAARDEGDEEYWEKYINKLTDNFMSGAFVLNWYPILRDVVSLFEGYSIERTDMSLVEDFVKATKTLASEKASVWKKIEAISGSIANLFGVPLKNILRDLKAIYNLIFN